MSSTGIKTTTVNLRAVAAAEALRLAIARAISRGARRPIHCRSSFDRVSSSGPLIARARGARRRLALGSRVLLLWRVACEDASRRTVADAIVAMLAEIEPAPPGRDTRSLIGSLADAIELRVPDAIERVLRAQQASLTDACRAQWQARVVRERAIADRLAASTSETPYQGGLFDRRTDRAHDQRTAETREFEERVRVRLLAATESSNAVPARPRLLLVLVP